MAVPFEQKLFGLVQVSVQGLRPGLDQSRTLKYGYTLTTTPNYHTNFLTSSSLHRMVKLNTIVTAQLQPKNKVGVTT